MAPKPFGEDVPDSWTVIAVSKELKSMPPKPLDNMAGTVGSAVFSHELFSPFHSTLAMVKAATGQ